MILENSLMNINSSDASSIAGLESVLSASHNGEHCMTSSFVVIHALLKLPLSMKGRAVLQKIRSNISLHGHLPYPESFILEIVSHGVAIKLNGRRWSIPVTDFKNKPFPSSIVLGENMLDAEAYFSAAQQARIKYRYREVCKTIPDAGGGSQTAVKLQGYLKQGNGYCFCVTDGDYREPNGLKSAVTTSCEQLVNQNTWPAFATDFDARSIENIIPIELVEDSYGSAPLPQSFHDYKSIYNADKQTATYIDAKAGLKYCGVIKMNADSFRYKFWWAKIEKHKLEMRFDALSKNPPSCPYNDCAKCTIIGGLGGGTLKQVVKYFNENTSHKLAKRVSLNSTWCDLGAKLYHWTMADKPAFS